MAGNIQSSPYPLVFPLAPDDGPGDTDTGAPPLRVCTLARALEGMQKEALVTGPGARGWRLVCDEGPYLNGTDLAPFPLAFFTAGLAGAYLAEVVALVAARGVPLPALELVQDSLYTMEGSAVRGDMRGGALPVALQVRVEREADIAAVGDLVLQAVAHSPADGLLRGAADSEFSIVSNGAPVDAGGVRPWRTPPRPDLSDAVFDRATPAPGVDFPSDIITRSVQAETVFGRDGGAGSSLQSEQKRTLHVRGIARLRDDGLGEIEVQLYRPIGSHFRFLCDVGGVGEAEGRAPSPLVYLSAGLAFCFLTQIGRYVTILKHPLSHYAIEQHTAFTPARGTQAAATAEAVRTHVALAGDLDDDTVRRIVDMGERTCFLHAASRTPLKTRVRVTGAAEPVSGPAVVASPDTSPPR